MNDIEAAVMKYKKQKQHEKYLSKRHLSREEINQRRKVRIAKEKEETKRPERKPYMSDREIADSFLLAIDPSRQIEILAQLNDVNVSEIESALERSGIFKRKGDKIVRVY